MPQISLEYTSSLGDEVPESLVPRLHRILADEGGVAVEACKTRVTRVDAFVSGDGSEDAGFAHLAVKIFPKDAAWKAQIGERLLEVLCEAFPGRGGAPLTVHIDDSIERDAYFKDAPTDGLASASTRSRRARVADAFAIKADTGSNAALLDLCADDMTWTIAGSGALCRTYTSKQDFVDNCLAVLGARLAGPITAEVEQILADGDTVVVRWRGRGRTTWGSPYENHYCWVFGFEGNLIQRATAYIDTLLLDRTMSHADGGEAP